MIVVNISGQDLDLPTIGYRMPAGSRIDVDAATGASLCEQAANFRMATPDDTGPMAQRLTAEEWAGGAPTSEARDGRLLTALWWEWHRSGVRGTKVLCPDNHRIGTIVMTSHGLVMFSDPPRHAKGQPAQGTLLMEENLVETKFVCRRCRAATYRIRPNQVTRIVGRRLPYLRVERVEPGAS